MSASEGSALWWPRPPGLWKSRDRDRDRGKRGYPVQGSTADEFACLNLNVFAPFSGDGDGDGGGGGGGEKKKEKEKKPLLPVLVWAHGGAYWTGCGSVDLYDASEIVARSVRLGSPVMVVTFNYRLGVLGFLHSREMARDATTTTTRSQSHHVSPEFRSTANLGVLDTLMAVEWVKKHIGTFGGDPDNITGMGESAGAAILNLTSLVKHLHLKIPRMILSSSTVFSNQLLTTPEAQVWFDRICDRTGVTIQNGDSVAASRALDVDVLIERTNFARTSFRPILDGITIPYDPRRAVFDSTLWDDALEQIVIGHCENESFLRLATHNGAVPSLKTTINGRVPPIGDLRARALKIYRGDDEAKPSPDFLWFGEPNLVKTSAAARSWMAFDGHSRYYAGPQLLLESFLKANSSSSPSPPPSSHPRTLMYKYLFSWVPRFWPQGWPATHTADVLPLFLHRGLSGSEVAVAQTLVDPLIYFVAGRNGDMSWRRYAAGEQEKKLNRIQRDGTWGVVDEGSWEFGLRKDIIDLWRDIIQASIEIGMDGWDGMIR